jgi:Uma2 family endonuclease
MVTIDALSVVLPADWIAGPRQGQWAYDDYAALSEEGQYEVVDGVLYMSPSPNVDHQEIIGEIFAHLRSFVRATGLGKVFIAPLDVKLSYNDVLQPDVFVLLHEHLDRVIHSHVLGAPDLVIEVTSPSTARHDLREKQDAYARAGVSEYWIVNPDAHTVELLILQNNVYRSLGLFSGEATLPSLVLSDFSTQVSQFFATTT